MIGPGQVILFRFPSADQSAAKLRPALLLKQLPGPFDDWQICMISSQLGQQIPGFDEVIGANDVDFIKSGLKLVSVIWISRVAVAQHSIVRGTIGQISPDRLRRIVIKLGEWITAL